jgi:CBS domain containing-hemolysin-like protein
MGILLIVVFVTIFISANCSLYEAVLYSTRIGALEASKNIQGKRKSAVLFLDMKKNISKPIAAILIMNTIANTAGATIAGMYASRVMNQTLVIVFSMAFTLLILFFAEIIPKTAGAIYWRNFWSSIIYPLKILNMVLRPFVFVTQAITKAISQKNKEKTFTEEEILAMVKLGAREGEISHQESNFVNNLISLENKTVKQIMTPRPVIFSLDSTLTIENAIVMAEGKGHTRLPVYEGDKENVIGYVLMNDLYKNNQKNSKGTNLKNIVRDVSFFDENTNCLKLLNFFLKNRNQIIIVLDEYQGLSGLATFEDVVETVFGVEIVDETDVTIDLQEKARKAKKSKQIIKD